MKKRYTYLSGLFSLLSIACFAQITKITGPAGSGSFGKHVTVLKNGNYVITDPGWDDGATTDVGAVYLYNGTTHAVISRLSGTTSGDQIGSNGVTALPNGNFVVRSPYWDNGATTNVGAVTWVSGSSGISGYVNISNSLTGSSSDDQTGTEAIVVLSNGNYLVRTPSWKNGSVSGAGAVTWANGNTGINGQISVGNSLIGTSSNDRIGNNLSTILTLTNGNYVVCSPSWDNGSESNTGAATWGDGSVGVSGIISSANSLIGNTANDQIGTRAIALSNGHYLVSSTTWDNGSVADAGAATWGNGFTGTVGLVSSTNSLAGTQTNDNVGQSITALTNGHYVVGSPNWDNGTASNVGAATWGNGTVGVTGTISSSNSLIGVTPNDQISGNGNQTPVVALSNGNYVVISKGWALAGTANVGAATWGNGATGTSGLVSESNSLVGSTSGDQGLCRITPLTNGNYVVCNPYWDSGANQDAGAATLGNGNTGIAGTISADNSLIGSSTGDNVGLSATALNNGHYVVASPYWNNTTGAATWGNGNTGIIGAVSASNSLIGLSPGHYVSIGGVIALKGNGNYVVSSPDASHTTWGNGNTGISGTISASNSLIGTNMRHYENNGTILALKNGNYVVNNPAWGPEYGAATWGNGNTGITGTINANNSMVGIFSNTQNGSPLTGYSDGTYVIPYPQQSSTYVSRAGSITMGNGTIGSVGPISSCNSTYGTVVGSGDALTFDYNETHKYLLVGYATANFYTIDNGQRGGLAANNVSSTRTVSGYPVTFSQNCSDIARVTTTGGGTAVNGSVTATAYVQNTKSSTGGQTYVRRHYEITPANNANTVTAKLTLFYNQSDFDTYNTDRGSAPALPTDPSDANGIGHLRITQYHGSSSSGLPGSYTGWTGSGPSIVLIDPDDNEVIWNSRERRWEVTFDVTGFSGFFAHSNVNDLPLPVSLVSFFAKKVEDAALLQWKTATEVNASHFEIEKSADAKTFRKIGFVKAAGNASIEQKYEFTDPQFATNGPVSYYRLRSVDLDGTFSYSKVTSLKNEQTANMNFVYPNPARNGATVIVNTNGETGKVTITDLTGRVANIPTTKMGDNSLQLNLKHVGEGMYFIKLQSASSTQTWKLVVE